MAQVRVIESLAETLHGSRAAADDFTFRSMQEHVEEVRVLLSQNDAHWKAETVDLILHGYILLERYGVSAQEMDALLLKRTGRFQEKIRAEIQKQ